ncbi:MAG: SDR family oxidoreductase [Sulfuricellaceae bacterium]|nr:SDR family oxidoreductase [Sulfuricellaceae bacterium]
MQKILIIGFGDIGSRVAEKLASRCHLYALVRSEATAVRARQLGAIPVMGDLDDPVSLRRLRGLADMVLHFAPPLRQGTRDRRTRHLVATLNSGKILPQRLIYISTTGVYGDCQGEVVRETRPCRPTTARAVRRADAESVLRRWGAHRGVQVSILRVPGIYAPNGHARFPLPSPPPAGEGDAGSLREFHVGRLPVERLEKRVPALCAEDDAHTNHIHADDLVRIIVAAMFHGRAGRVYNAADDTPMKMANYFDLVADYLHLERPRRISWAEAQKEISPGMLSYMNESRRISNTRIKQELGVRLRYPGVANCLGEAPPSIMKQRSAKTVPLSPDSLPEGERDAGSLREFHVKGLAHAD